MYGTVIDSFVFIYYTSEITMTNATIERKTYTLDEVDALDEMLPLDAAAWQMLEHPNLLYQACRHYLTWYPDAWDKLANEQKLSNKNQ